MGQKRLLPVGFPAPPRVVSARCLPTRGCLGVGAEVGLWWLTAPPPPLPGAGMNGE